MSVEPVARPHPEAVVLNVGGSLGALVVHWDAEHLDTPIEISPTDNDAERQHQHVLQRPFDDRTFYAAVFDALPAGTYTLWVHEQARAHHVAISGGDVMQLRWPATGSD